VKRQACFKHCLTLSERPNTDESPRNAKNAFVIGTGFAVRVVRVCEYCSFLEHQHNQITRENGVRLERKSNATKNCGTFFHLSCLEGPLDPLYYFCWRGKRQQRLPLQFREQNSTMMRRCRAFRSLDSLAHPGAAARTLERVIQQNLCVASAAATTEELALRQAIFLQGHEEEFLARSSPDSLFHRRREQNCLRHTFTKRIPSC